MTIEIINRWTEYDHDRKRFTFEQTRKYVWGQVRGQNTPIGEMDRELLFQVIADAYATLDMLSQALIDAVPSADAAKEIGIESARKIALKRATAVLGWKANHPDSVAAKSDDRR